MRELEFRNVGERQARRLSLAVPTLVLVILGVALLAIILFSGTTGQADVSIPTRLFPAT